MLELSSIHQAVYDNDIRSISTMLTDGADIEGRAQNGNFFGKTPLIIAAMEDHTEVIDFLIDKGAQIDAKDLNSGATALMNAAIKNKIRSIHTLLKHGANIEARNDSGRTAIYDAICSKKHDAVSLLLAKGADINTKDNNENTPLHMAAWISSQTGVFLSLELLLGSHADRSTKNVNGHKPYENIMSFESKYTPIIRTMICNQDESLLACARTCIRTRLISNGFDISTEKSSGIASLPLPIPLKRYICTPLKL